jgi:hypothetical protein
VSYRLERFQSLLTTGEQLTHQIRITQFWILRQQLDYHVSTTMGYTGLDGLDSIASEKCSRRWVWLSGSKVGVAAGINDGVQPA